MPPIDPELEPNNAAPELDPDYDILLDEELMRILGLHPKAPAQPTEMHIATPGISKSPKHAAEEPEAQPEDSAGPELILPPKSHRVQVHREPTPQKPLVQEPASQKAIPQKGAFQKGVSKKAASQEGEKLSIKKGKKKKLNAAANQTRSKLPASEQPEKKTHSSGLWWSALLACLYFELLLFFATPDKSFGRFIVTCLFAVAWSQGVYLVLRLLIRPGLQRVAGGILLGVGAFWFGLQYFLKDFFKNYMNLNAILHSAGGVAGSYSNTIVEVLLNGWWMVLLLAVPLICWIAFRKRISISRCMVFTKGKAGSRDRMDLALRLCTLAAAHVLALLVVLLFPVLRTGYSESRTSMTFDKHVSSYGLLTASRLDLRSSLFGGSSSVSFEIPVSTQAPTEPAPTTSTPNAPESTETTAPTEAPAETTSAYHVMDIDFDALIANADDDDVAAIHEYVKSLTPAPTNQYTGLFKGKNLILVTAESFSAEVIDPELTPTLYRMAHQGIEFTEFYQPTWGGSTSTGEYSFVMGLVPTHSAESMVVASENNVDLTMGNQLRKLGYFSRAYHNNTYDFYSRDKTHEHMGYDKYYGVGNGLEEGITQQWPESDLEMIDYTLPQYIDHQPFSVYYMTVSGHGSWRPGTNCMSEKNFEATEGLGYSTTVRNYIAANLELEYAMTSLIKQLEDAGIADDTVIALCPDHYPYMLRPSSSDDTDYLSELYGYVDETLPQQDHSALIIWSGCLEKMEHIVVDSPVYSLDILPTLSNLFGLEYDSRLMVGRDVFSDAEPLIIWPSYSWKTDKGYYSAHYDTFTPDEGVGDVSEEYIERIHAIVRNRIRFSGAVLDYDYYGILFDDQ